MAEFRVGDIVKVKESGVYGRIYYVNRKDYSCHRFSVEFFSKEELEESSGSYKEDEIEIASELPMELLFAALQVMSHSLAEFEKQMNEEVAYLQREIDGPDPWEE